MPMSTLAKAALAILLAATGSLAQISTDEARSLASQALGVSMDTARATTQDVGGRTWIELTTEDDLGRRLSARIDSSTGQLVSFYRDMPRPEAPPDKPLTNEEAKRAAASVAARFLPAGTTEIQWEVVDSDDFGVVLDGWGEPVGDPPRRGLSPHCRAIVSLADGSVCSYSQNIPDAADLIDPRVTAEEAMAAACAETGGRVTGEPPSLGQHGQELTWYVQVLLPPGDEEGSADPVGQAHATVLVDGLTGEVRRVEPSAGAVTPEASGASQTTQAPLRAPARTDLEPALHPRDAKERHRRQLLRVALPLGLALLVVAAMVGAVLYHRRMSASGGSRE